MNKYKIVIIGAGPTGLGAANRLNELGEQDYIIYDRNSYAGGLASSFQDEEGFWWDIGGHVQFSHYEYFDKLMDELLPGGWLDHQRESWVWMFDRFIPYPFQNNIHNLPKEVMKKCFEGIIDVYKKGVNNSKPANFKEWILATSGAEIAKHFMFPYNFKVWAYPPEMMNAEWVGERVAVTDMGRVFNNILEHEDDVSWGPNSTFRFPLKGGTGSIWKKLGKKIGKSHITLNHEVAQIDTQRKRLKFSNSEEVEYDYLISTMPLDLMIQKSDLPDTLKEASKKLKHSTTHIVGVGLEGQPKEELATKCWMYFPENNCPFYRVTLFSKYSPNNVPDITKNFSLMTEISESDFKPVNEEKLVDEVIEGLRATKLISPQDKIVSTWKHTEKYGYPTPSLERNDTLKAVMPELMRRNILSRGRFGMWKYEVSNQDHSLMQGVEAAEFIMLGIPERTAWYPNVVNGPKPY